MVEDAGLARELIAKRVAKELKDGQLVNLGIGLPTEVANYLPEGVNVILQSENGMVGMTEAPDPINPNIVNAGGQPVGAEPLAAFFDSVTSFSLIRGGHVDVSVLGTLEVDEQGDLANWIIPGKMVPGMGGAMDLVVGSRKVIIAMQHTSRGNPKILKKCKLPLTARGVVDMIITELCVIEVREEGLVVTEIFENSNKEEIINLTEADLIFKV